MGQVEHLQEHIDDLAKELNCIVEQGFNVPGMMYVEEFPPRIEGPLIGALNQHICPSDEAAYLVMLHELGHVYHVHTQGRPPHDNDKFYFENGVLKSEAQAWDYALDQTIIEPGEVERLWMWGHCLGSYYAGAYRADGTRWNFRDDNRLGNGWRHHVAFRYDDVDEYFYSVKERILDNE